VLDVAGSVHEMARYRRQLMQAFQVTRAASTYSAMHQQDGTIQLFAAAKCQLLDI